MQGGAFGILPRWSHSRRDAAFFPRSRNIADRQIKIGRFAERSLGEEISAPVGTPGWLLIHFEGLAQIACLDGRHAGTCEVQPASEGFFAVADRADCEGLRLLLDTGIFCEFILVDQLNSAQPDCRWVGDV